MSKFLSETGLKYFWEKIKTHLSGNYLSLNGGTMNKNASITITQTGDDGDNDPKQGETLLEGRNISITDGVDNVSLGLDSGLSLNDDSGNASSVETDTIQITTKNGLTNPTSSITSSKFSTNYIKNNKTKEETTIAGNHIITKSTSTSDTDSYSQTEINSAGVTSPKFVKQGGTASEVLLANGSIATLNAANGIPKLDANGKIPLSQLGNLDTTLFEVVTALPTTSIKKNRIYLLKVNKPGIQNFYAEYIYTGDVSATYNASKWEKLGEYKSDVDLSSYSKTSETIKSITFSSDAYEVKANMRLANNTDYTEGGASISSATTSSAGVMTASDKKALNTLTARYPLSIASFTASPSLVEVGVSADITFAWTFNNTDFHPITAQGIVVDGAASVSVDKSTKTYKKTGLAGATSATTKSATLTVNGSLTKSVNVTYHYPTYIGVVANGTSITETVVKGLTKSIEWGKGKSATLTQSNQQIVYAYPASYGDLTSIKDGNGFEGFAGYTKSTLTVGGQTYNVYKQTLPATASSKYTFA